MRTASRLEKANEEAKQKVRELAKRPFPFGYGLRELTERFEVATIENALTTKHEQPLA